VFGLWSLVFSLWSLVCQKVISSLISPFSPFRSGKRPYCSLIRRLAWHRLLQHCWFLWFPRSLSLFQLLPLCCSTLSTRTVGLSSTCSSVPFSFQPTVFSADQSRAKSSGLRAASGFVFWTVSGFRLARWSLLLSSSPVPTEVQRAMCDKTQNLTDFRPAATPLQSSTPHPTLDIEILSRSVIPSP